MALDLTKPLRTIGCKRPVRIIDEDCNGLVVYAQFTGDNWLMAECRKRHLEGHLENVPECRTLDCWLNVYGEGINNRTHRTKEEADRSSFSNRIACVHIQQEYEVGEGL